MEPDVQACGSGRGVKLAIVTVDAPIGPSDGSAGGVVAESLERHGHRVLRRLPARSDHGDVQRALREAIEDSDVQAIVIVGGTGLSGSDVTMEAVEAFEEKPIPGFGEALRALSAELLGSRSVLVRCSAFVSEAKLVFCLPSSRPVAQLAAERLIGPVLGAAVAEAGR